MLGFLTRDQELITRKVTPGTPRLALTETPERRCEMDDESVRERERERDSDRQREKEQLRAKVPERSMGTSGGRAETETRGTNTYKQQESRH